MTEATLDRKLDGLEARSSAEARCPHFGSKIVTVRHGAGGNGFPHYECGTGYMGFPQSACCEEREDNQVFEKPIFIWAQEETK